MRKFFSLLGILIITVITADAQIGFVNNCPQFKLNGTTLISPSSEGLWSVATGWNNDWMTEWHYANPEKMEQNGDWTILSGKMVFPQGILVMRDSYKEIRKDLVKCVRRFEWQGKDTLKHVTLTIRFQLKGNHMQAFLPGILYYGNKNGAKINPNIIPVYNGQDGEFAIFEDHRYPMPFAMLENASAKYAAAIHTTPSPVRGAVLNDQWWSLGVEAYNGHSDFVLYSGPIGYNKKHSVAKALQQSPMKYTDTYLNLEPGRIIEKEFYVELYPIEREGTGFEQPIYTSLDLHKPYDADRFTSFNEIVMDKYRFAKSRWLEFDNKAVGFNMYDISYRKDIVMGWCGQADSPGYFLQVLNARINDSTISDKVQRSMDFLSTFPVNSQNGSFPVGYDGKKFHEGDPVSCGQAMYNFAKAIETARKSHLHNTQAWEVFLKHACDGVSKYILDKNWNPVSTAEGFYIASLVLSSKLFNNDTYKEAAIKAGQTFADRHLNMNGCYWGGTLDATCEDKEGAWAAFQGFITLYEQYNDTKYLNWAKHAMNVCLSYVVDWDISLPAGRLADFNFKTTGWTVVSPQNQHLDVYGVLFAPEIYKMGTYLNDTRLQKLAKVMFRTCSQLMNPYGSQGEQIQHTNFAQNGDMSNVHKLRGGYSEGWTVFWITAHFLNAAARFEEMNVIP
jgi:hypothetical protein